MAPPRPKPRRRFRKRWLLVPLAGVSAVGGVFVVALAWVGTGGGSRWVANRIEAAVEARTRSADLAIGSLSLGLHAVSASGITLVNADGQTLLAIDRVDATLDPWVLLTGAVYLPEVRVQGVTVEARANAEGELDWQRLFLPSTSTEPFSSPLDVRIDALLVDGVAGRWRTPTSTVGQLDAGHLYGRLVVHRTTVDLSELDVGAELVAPGPLAVGGWGGLQWDSRKGVWLRDAEVALGNSHASATGLVGHTFDLAVSVGLLEGSDVGTLLGRPLASSWSGGLTAKGPPGDVAVAAGFGELGGAGALTLAGKLDTSGASPAWSAMVELAQLHVEAVYPSLGQPVVLDGRLAVDGVGFAPGSAVLDGAWRGGGQVFYGQPVDAVDARFRLREGRIEVLPSPVTGILGTMVVSGTYDLTGALDLQLTTDLSPERLAALGSAGLDGRGRLDARVVRAVGEPAVTIAGTARYAPFLYGRDVRVASLTAPFTARVEGGVVKGELDLAGADVTAYGAHTEGVRGKGLRFTRAADGQILVSGAVSTPGFAFTTQATAATADTSFSFWKDAAHRTVEATTTLGPHSLLGVPATGGTVVTSMSDDQLRAEVHLVDGDRPSLTTTARYDLRAAALVLDALAWAPTPRTTWTADAPMTMTLVSGGVADARIALTSPIGHAEVAGRVATTGPLAGTVTLRGFELDHLTELYPESYDLGGALDLDLTLTGTAEAPVVDGVVDLKRLFANGSVRWLDVAGPVRWAEGVLVPDLALAAAGTSLAHVSGKIPVTGPLSAPVLALDTPATVSLAVVPGGYDRVPLVFPAMEGTELPEGRFSLSVVATGPLRDPDVRLATVSEAEVNGWGEVGRAEVVLTRHAGELAFDGDLREGMGLRATVNGEGTTRMGEVFAWLHGLGPEVALSEPALWLSDLSVSTALVGVPAESLGVAAGAPVALGGELVGGFVVTGDANAPVVDGAVNWLDPSVGGQAFDGAYFALVPAPTGGYALDATAAFPDGGGLEVHGAVPVTVDLDRARTEWSDGPLALTVSGAGVPVSLLAVATPELQGGVGLVQVGGTIGGTLDDPRPELVVHGEGLGLALRPYGLTTADARLDATVSHDAVTFDLKVPTLPTRRFAAFQIDPGVNPRIRLKGTVALTDWAPAAVDAKVHMYDGAWLAATDLTKLRMDGDLRIDGAWPALKVRGDLSLAQGLVGFEAAGFAEAAPLDLSPGLTVVRTAAPTVAVAPPTPSLASDFDVAVGLDLARNLQLELSMPFVDQLGAIGATVTRMDLATRLGGAVKVSSVDGAPALSGEVELLDGTVRLLRSTFDLQDGRISFTGGDPYEDAELDIEASMAVSGASLNLAITGTPVKPEFRLQSDAFPDPTQQMVILLTGTSPDDLTSDAGAGAALSLLWTSVLAGTRLGSFSIEPSGAVRLGFPVSPKLYTSTTWLLTTDPTANALTFEADWTLAPHLVANGAIGDRNSWGDLYWELRF